jgi:hypothetical protein
MGQEVTAGLRTASLHGMRSVDEGSSKQGEHFHTSYI